MIFTLRANQRQVERAAIKARKEAWEEGHRKQQQKWLEWYEQVKDYLPSDAPPPPSLNNGNSNESKGD